LLFLPWLAVAVSQLSAQPNLSQPLPLDETIRQILGFFAVGSSFELNNRDLMFFAYAFLLFGLVPLPLNSRTVWNITVPVTWVIVSAAAYLHLDLTDRYLRFLLPAQLGFALWVGRGVWIVWTLQRNDWAPRWRDKAKYVAVFCTALLLLPLFGNLDLLYHHPNFQRDDVRGLTARIESDLKADDAILVSAAGFSEILGYYYQGAAPVYGLPVSSDSSATRAQVLDIIAAHDRLHVIFYGAEEQDPEQIVETTLNLNAFEISDRWVDDMRYAQYKGGAVRLLAQRASHIFGDSITLESYALGARVVKAGDILPVQLTWRTDAALDQRYKVFLQLLDADGRLAAQRDSEPAGGSAQTTAWSVDETVVDSHALQIPPDLPAGDYTLIAGLYHISDPSARLAVADSTFVNLGTVTLQ